MFDREQRRPRLDALVSNATQRRNNAFSSPKRVETRPLEDQGTDDSPPSLVLLRTSRARKNLVKTRMSDSEYRTFTERVQRSGLSASEFLRRAALTGQIVLPVHTELDLTLLDELALLKADVGRIGGLLKMTIRPNEGQRTLHPTEWEELLHAVRQAERMTEHLAELEAKIADGYHQT